MTSGRRLFFRAVLIAGLGLGGLFAAPTVEWPTSWKVEITLEARGKYQLGAPEREYRGSYAFAFRWNGTLERDDQDFLLVHNGCELVRWEIEESATAGNSLVILKTPEITEKPELKVNYILKEKGVLLFNFLVMGFDVPRNPSAEHFYLILPASAENSGRFEGIHYNPCVKTGSNQIAIEETPVLHGPLEKSFSWTWEHQGWVQGLEHTVFQANGHEARVKIAITPRESSLRSHQEHHAFLSPPRVSSPDTYKPSLSQDV
jgi:hypothetical protein